jgi:hypothetical protein
MKKHVTAAGLRQWPWMPVMCRTRSLGFGIGVRLGMSLAMPPVRSKLGPLRTVRQGAALG